MIRSVAKVVGFGGLILGASTFQVKYQRDEGFRRAVRLYSQALPVVAHYRLTQLRHRLDFENLSDEEKAQEWLSLDKKHSGPITDLVKDLRGMYVKYAQIGAGVTNTFSEIWIEKFRELEDAVPPQSIEVARRTIEEDLGKPLEEIFDEFEESVLGSASIGQVHKAKLKGSEKFVAVKVQYPDSGRLFREDMKTIRGFMEIAAPEQVIILDELERSFEREFDYRCESENLEKVRKNLARKFDKEIVVPKPIFSTERVLVMEFLDGVKLVDGIRAYGEVIAKEQGKTWEEFEGEMKRKVLEEGPPARYNGWSSNVISLYVSFVRARDFIVNKIIALLPFNVKEWKTVIPPNAPRIMDILMRVHGQQILVDGCFQADPHAGNFLWLKDDRIGLIDYGATKELTQSERLAACLLYAALYKGDKEKIIQMVRVGGYRSKFFDHDVIFDVVRFAYDDYSRDLLKGRNIQQFMDELYSKDPWQEAPDNLAMAQFLSLRLRGVGMSLMFPVRCSEYWGPIAIEVLENEGTPYELFDEEMMKERLDDGLRSAKGSKTRSLLN